MKKLARFFFLIFLVVIFCTACKGDINREIRHAGFGMTGEFSCSKFLPSDKNDTSYEKIRYMTGNHIITKEGKIYELSLTQKFANNDNCKEAGGDITVQAMFDSNIVKGTDGKYYYLVAQNNTPVYTEVTELDNSYELYNLLLSDTDIIKVTTVDSSSGLYYVLKTDGNVYSYVIAKDDYNSPLAIKEIVTAYSSSQYGQIIDYNFAGNNLSTFILSENKLYRMQITNLEECNKYADVDCKYELKEEPIYEKYKDIIISYNGSMLITDYGQIFSVAS
ncbi:MAG: hypothetical protein IJI22_03495 [Bacilli bacterium]|nr:hypothetical protein [Bacilli bacterium]